MNEKAVVDRKQQKRGEKTVRKVLDAARVLMAEGGFDAVQLAQISAESSVSTGSLYHHFGSKEGIITRMIDEFTDQAMTDLEKLDLVGLSFDERLWRLLCLTCDQFRDNPEFYRSMSERVRSQPAIWAPLRELRRAFEYRLLTELADDLKQRGILDPQIAIHRMMQAVLGVLTHSVVFGSGPVKINKPCLNNEIFAIGRAILFLPAPEENT
ncbi:TetR/AcrR family transcriptional regulator [Marivita sp. S0852]|uniref:TetR/AcrR family transcriptional regulator n=1 Tax=Marivita sp. S0852 TaxID=3373893 RepID=UPI003982D234